MRNKIDNYEFNIFDRILSKMFKRHTYKIYQYGILVGYNWAKSNKFH